MDTKLAVAFTNIFMMAKIKTQILDKSVNKLNRLETLHDEIFFLWNIQQRCRQIVFLQ